MSVIGGINNGIDIVGMQSASEKPEVEDVEAVSCADEAVAAAEKLTSVSVGKPVSDLVRDFIIAKIGSGRHEDEKKTSRSSSHHKTSKHKRKKKKHKSGHKKKSSKHHRHSKDKIDNDHLPVQHSNDVTEEFTHHDVERCTANLVSSDMHDDSMITSEKCECVTECNLYIFPPHEDKSSDKQLDDVGKGGVASPSVNLQNVNLSEAKAVLAEPSEVGNKMDAMPEESHFSNFGKVLHDSCNATANKTSTLKNEGIGNGSCGSQHASCTSDVLNQANESVAHDICVRNDPSERSSSNGIEDQHQIKTDVMRLTESGLSVRVEKCSATECEEHCTTEQQENWHCEKNQFEETDQDALTSINHQKKSGLAKYGKEYENKSEENVCSSQRKSCSKEKSQKRSRSRRISRRRSKSKEKSRKRSRSRGTNRKSKKKEKSRKRSRSRGTSRKRSKSQERSRKRSRSRRTSRKRSKSNEQSCRRSRSRDKRSRSKGHNEKRSRRRETNQKRSKSKEHNRKRSRSKEMSQKRSGSKKRSRSRGTSKTGARSTEKSRQRSRSEERSRQRSGNRETSRKRSRSEEMCPRRSRSTGIISGSETAEVLQNKNSIHKHNHCDKLEVKSGVPGDDFIDKAGANHSTVKSSEKLEQKDELCCFTCQNVIEKDVRMEEETSKQVAKEKYGEAPGKSEQKSECVEDNKSSSKKVDAKSSKIAENRCCEKLLNTDDICQKEEDECANSKKSEYEIQDKNYLRKNRPHQKGGEHDRQKSSEHHGSKERNSSSAVEKDEALEKWKYKRRSCQRGIERSRSREYRYDEKTSSQHKKVEQDKLEVQEVKRSKQRQCYSQNSDDTDESSSPPRHRVKLEMKSLKEPYVVQVSDDDADVISEKMMEKLHKRLTTSIKKSKELQAEREMGLTSSSLAAIMLITSDEEPNSETSATFHSEHRVEQKRDDTIDLCAASVDISSIPDIPMPPSPLPSIMIDVPHKVAADEALKTISGKPSKALGFAKKSGLKLGLKISESSAARISLGVKGDAPEAGQQMQTNAGRCWKCLIVHVISVVNTLLCLYV
jgi:hypothetical protein